MTPEDIKAQFQGAYTRAIANSSMQMSRGSNIHHLFRDVRLYGLDAGTDFVETNLTQIVQEAVATAGCKSASMDIPAHGFGNAAISGMMQVLERLTALKTEVNRTTITLIWAEPNPGLV